MLTHREDREQGLTLVMVALTLVALMVFAAFAVDLGGVYTERRKDQNAVDAAVMSGAVQLLSKQSSQAAVTEIIARVSEDLGRTVPVTDWSACTDGNQLELTAAELSLVPSTPCISFTSGFTRLRVRIPDQVIRAPFGRVIGVTDYSSYAFAEAGVLPRGGGALPFVVLDTSGTGDQVCLRTDGTGGGEPPDQPAIPPYVPARVLDPCNELSFPTHEGGRGTIKPYMYLGCSKPTGNQSIVDAIMVGTDHLLGTFEPEVSYSPNADANLTDLSSSARHDGANSCQTLMPNTVDIDTGLTAQLLTCSLLRNPCNSGSSATSGKPGRLSSTSGSATFAGLQVDDVGLWDYFLPSLPAAAPAACNDTKSLSASGNSFYTKRAALALCLKNWTPAVGQLFADAIGDAKRLGFVPKIAENCLNRNQLPACTQPLDNVHINSFVPAYIDGLYQDSGGTCDTTNPATPVADSAGWSIHYPGKGLACGSGNVVHRVSGLVLPCGALPREVCDPTLNPPFADPVGINSIRLVK